MNHWWRAYDEAVNDSKLQLLSDPLFRAWFNVMCIASANDGRLPSLESVAFTLHMKNERAAQVLAQLHQHGLLDKTETGFVPHNWNGRQYKSDVTDATASERMKRYREKQRNDRNATVTVTPPREQTTETDTEDPSLRSGARAKATRLQDDWMPDQSDQDFAKAKGLSNDRLQTEALKFRNYWTSKSGKDATKTNWQRTWQNWILNSKGSPNGNGTFNGAHRSSSSDFFAGIASVAADIVGEGQPSRFADEEIPLGRVNIDG